MVIRGEHPLLASSPACDDKAINHRMEGMMCLDPRSRLVNQEG